MDVPAILAAIKSLETTIDSYFSVTNNTFQEIQSSLDTYSSYLHRTSSDLESKISTLESDKATVSQSISVISEFAPPIQLTEPHGSLTQLTVQSKPIMKKDSEFLPKSPPPINFIDLQKSQSNGIILEKSPYDMQESPSNLQESHSLPTEISKPNSALSQSTPQLQNPFSTPTPPQSMFQPPLPQTPPPPITPQPTEPPPTDTLPLPATLPPKFPPPYSSLQIFSDPPCSSLSTVANPIAEVPLPTPQLQPSLFQTPPLPVKELSSTEIDEQRERMLCDGADQKFYIFVHCHGDSFWPIDTKDWRESDSLERILRLQVSFIPPSPQVMLGGEPPPILSLIWNQEHKIIDSSDGLKSFEEIPYEGKIDYKVPGFLRLLLPRMSLCASALEWEKNILTCIGLEG